MRVARGGAVTPGWPPLSRASSRVTVKTHEGARMPAQNPRVNKPVTIRIPCPGYDPGATVTVKVLELSNLGGDPVETLQATVDEAGASATVRWTYDHSQHQDKVSGACFVLLVEANGRSTMSRPIQFLDHFAATVAD